MFFKTKPNVVDGEKARIEYHLQQISDCLGGDSFKRPVIRRSELLDWSAAGTDPQAVIARVGEHLQCDISGLTINVVPSETRDGGGCSSGGCGGGSCSGQSSLPGSYHAESRTVTLGIEPNQDVEGATAALINAGITDVLCRSIPMYDRFPELVDMACVTVGLGAIRSNIQLVTKQPLFWDSTQWSTVARPFLGYPGLAYTNAIAAWVRGESSPAWADDLNAEVRSPMKKSLKYLNQTGDSFFQPQAASSSNLNQSAEQWWRLLESGKNSEQIIAVRHLPTNNAPSAQQERLLIERLRSRNSAIVLNTISTVEQMPSAEPIAEVLRDLVQDRNSEIQAKSLCAISRLGELDDRALDSATELLEGGVPHCVFAGLVALASQKELSELQLDSTDRTLKRCLGSCNYEFVTLLTAAYKTWVPDPKAHISNLLANDPDLLEVALDSLQGVPEQLVSIERDVA